MSADPLEICRIDLDADTSVWIAAGRAAGDDRDDPPSPRRAITRVRPAAALAAAAVAGVALIRLGLTPGGLMAAWALSVLTILAAIDLEVRLLPNRIVFPAIVAAVVWQGVFFPDRLAGCLVAGVGAGLVLLLPGLIQRGAVGMGDVKVAAFLGVVLGVDVIAALLAASLLSAPVALGMLVVRKGAARRDALPFGPFLALGAALVLLV